MKHVPGKGEHSINCAKRRKEYCSLPTSKLELPSSRLKDLAVTLHPSRSMWAEIISEVVCDLQQPVASSFIRSYLLFHD